MSDLAGGCFKIIFEAILILGWKAVQSGTWIALPFIVFFVAVCAFILSANVPYLQTYRAIDLTSDQLSLMRTVANTDQIYHVSGSGMANLSSGATAPYYGLLHIGSHYLLVTSPTPIDESLWAYSGRLDPYLTSVPEQLLEDFPDQRAALLPVYFTVYQAKFDINSMIVLIVEILIFILTGYSIWRFISVTLLKRV